MSAFSLYCVIFRKTLKSHIGNYLQIRIIKGLTVFHSTSISNKISFIIKSALNKFILYYKLTYWVLTNV